MKRKTVGQFGFTLLELLVAISIFGTVIGLAYASYNASFTIIDDAGKSNATYMKAKVTLERIIEDLESLYVGQKMIFVGNDSLEVGDNTTLLQFTSTAFVRLHPDDVSPGYSLVIYAIREDSESGSLLLYRSQLLAQDAEEAEEADADIALLLCDNLKEVIFSYRNQDGELMETWGIDEMVKDATGLPLLIQITLRFDDSDDSDDEEGGTLFQTSVLLPMAQI